MKNRIKFHTKCKKCSQSENFFKKALTLALYSAKIIKNKIEQSVWIIGRFIMTVNALYVIINVLVSIILLLGVTSKNSAKSCA